MKNMQYLRGKPAARGRGGAVAPARVSVEPLESRQLLWSVGEEDLFGPAQSVHASSRDASAAFAPQNLLDGTAAAFRFADGAAPQRVSLSHFNATVHTLRLFDAPSYADRTPASVTVYYSPLEQLSLTPASYVLLGTFALPTVNTTGGAQADGFSTPTRPADHPRSTDPGANASATVGYAEISNLTIPQNTQSLLLDFGINPAGLGFALSEVQAVGYDAARRAPDAALLGWGRGVYNETVESLKVPGSNLFAENANLNGTRFGGNGGFAYVWPAATQFRVLNALARLEPATYRPVLRAYADELHARYWRTTGLGGYRSGVTPGTGIFYDDNGHLVVSYAEAFHLTGDRTYLDRAVQTYNYVMTGEDSRGGGGIYFEEGDPTSKDAISTLQAARGAAMLHQLTGDARYLADASRLLAWSNARIRDAGGLYYERYRLSGAGSGAPEGFTLINSAGIALSLNLLLYDATGNAAHLREAQRIGRASLGRYFSGSSGAINDEGQWAFELVTALDDLHLRDHNPTWLTAVRNAMTWLRTNREDPNGHYGQLWGRDPYTPGTVRFQWHLNDQAAVAVSYLYTAAVNTVAPPFVASLGNSVIGIWNATPGGDATPAGPGTGAGRFPPTDPPPGAIDRNASTKHVNYGNGDSTVASATKGVGTGFVLTPGAGQTIVTGIQVATAGDLPDRDPLTVSIEGTNVTASGLMSGASWTLIADDVNLNIDSEQNRLTFGAVARFMNTTPYRSYRVIIKRQRGVETAVQYGELNLLGAPDARAGHSVAARQVFYNSSAASDDAEIATDKAPLRPGQTASFSNVTNYSRGINGIMVDVAGLPASRAPTAADFLLEVLSGGQWVPAPAAAEVSVRRGAGAGGSDRVTLVLPDGAVRNTWLRVTARSSLRTGLPSPDVFYFGNLAGDTGGGGTPVVNAIDVARTRFNFGRTTAAALAASDFNRDGRVNAVDVGIVRSNQRRALALFTAPAAGAPAAAAVSSKLPTPPPPRSGANPQRRGVWGESPPDLLA